MRDINANKNGGECRMCENEYIFYSYVYVEYSSIGAII